MYFRTNETAPPYRLGMDRKSVYKGVWQRYWREFREIYLYVYEDRYGELTLEKTAEVYKLLSCGDYRNGFRKHTCPECGTVLMVPFTCKPRLCPQTVRCTARKIETGELTTNEHESIRIVV